MVEEAAAAVANILPLELVAVGDCVVAEDIEAAAAAEARMAAAEARTPSCLKAVHMGTVELAMAALRR